MPLLQMPNVRRCRVWEGFQVILRQGMEAVQTTNRFRRAVHALSVPASPSAVPPASSVAHSKGTAAMARLVNTAAPPPSADCTPPMSGTAVLVALPAGPPSRNRHHAALTVQPGLPAPQAFTTRARSARRAHTGEVRSFIVATSAPLSRLEAGRL